jgi:catechol 2,3-dioxygenase-like lactoylglutathione lyase family enzyme
MKSIRALRLAEAASGAKEGMMTIRRVMPNIASMDPKASRAFYVDVLGFKVAMDMGWIVTFASPENPTAQVSVIRTDDARTPHPDFTVEVTDVDATHTRALAHGHDVVYPLTDEPWGVRRFFLRDPNGKIVNIMRHQSGP